MIKIQLIFMARIFMIFLVACLAPIEIIHASQSKLKMQPSFVEVIKIQTSTSRDHIIATGNLIAIPGIVVKAEIAGRITNIYFNSSSKIKARTPLLEIYPNIIRSRFTQARAELKLAQQHFNRMAKLHKTHIISDEDYDKTKTSLESNEAKVEELQAELDKTVIRAPFDGSLGVSLVSLGQYVNIGQDIVSLQALDPIYVDFTIPEIYSSKVAIGENVYVLPTAYPNEIFSGIINAIDPLVNKNTRSLTVRATIANKAEKLLPGTFAEVRVFINAPKQVIKIPQTAVIHEQDKNYIYRVIDGKAVKTGVIIGRYDAEDVIIENGLSIGDIIVSKGQLQIHKDGSPVTIVSAIK